MDFAFSLVHQVGTVDLLNCYYAHSEDSALFQRRAYWLLDAVESEVVLVHYLEVPKGSGSARILGFTGRNSPTPAANPMADPTSLQQESQERLANEEQSDPQTSWHAMARNTLDTASGSSGSSRHTGLKEHESESNAG